MAKKKAKVGRPVTVGVSDAITLRLPSKLQKALDAWCRQHKNGDPPSRAMAIRYFVEQGLKPRGK
jgi:hypothetical protein